MYSGLISFSESGMVGKMAAQMQILKPYLTLIRMKGRIEVSFQMESQEAIQLFSRRGNEADFQLLTETNQSPFVDERPNLTEYSETREYKAVFTKGGEAIGEEDSLKIRTKGRFRFF